MIYNLLKSHLKNFDKTSLILVFIIFFKNKKKKKINCCYLLNFLNSLGFCQGVDSTPWQKLIFNTVEY